MGHMCGVCESMHECVTIYILQEQIAVVESFFGVWFNVFRLLERVCVGGLVMHVCLHMLSLV